MTRTIDSATVTALASDSIRMATLVQFDFDTVIRLTDWGHDLTALSETWIASGHLLGASDALETSEPRVNQMTIQLSGVEQTYISIFLNNAYHGVRARVWKAVLDTDSSVIGAPILTFDGPIDSFGIDDSDDKSTLQVAVASHWSNFDAVSGRKTNHNSQQLYFPGDMGFEYSADTVKDIKWGRE